MLPPTLAVHAQSFDCQKAYYADEKAICQDSQLGQFDQQLAAVYGRWVGRLPREVRDQIQANETLFVQARRRCGQNRKCIEQSYRNRIEEIQEAIREESPDRRERAGSADLRGRPDDLSSARPERELRSGEQPSGASGGPVQQSVREQDRGSNKAATERPSEPARSTPPPAVTDTPTRAEAAEALRSSEREAPGEREPTKRHHRKARAYTAPASPPEGEPPSSRPQPSRGQPESATEETRAAATPQPKRSVSKQAPAVAGSATAPSQQSSAPAEAKPSTGSGSPRIQWVNPPPESGQH